MNDNTRDVVTAIAGFVFTVIVLAIIMFSPPSHPNYERRCAEEGGEFENGMCYMTKPELPAYHK